MDEVLRPWSAAVLYRRLAEAEREAEAELVAVEEGWLAGEGDVGEFVRGWVEGGGRFWWRREARRRWDEGRVGGWR